MNDRQKEIYNYIKKKKVVKNTDLINNLYLSEATLRRDLSALESGGFIERTHGGAKLKESPIDESPLLLRFNTRVKEKRKIAYECLSFISSSKSYFLDSSSTVGHLISNFKDKSDVVVITNGLYNALLFSQTGGPKVYLPSGIVSNKTNSITGSEALDFIKNFNTDYTFISCSGISLTSGITEYSYEQSIIKKAMLERSKKNILLVDKSKFNKTNLCKTCDLSSIHVIITDAMPDMAYIDLFKEHHIELIVCNNKN